MKRIAVSAAAIVWCGTAHATGGFSCSVADKVMSLDIQAGVTRGMGSPVFSLQGAMHLADETLADDLRDMRFEREHLAQYWLDGEELRFVLYRERGEEKPHGEVQLTVAARAGADGTYTGTYELKGSDMTGGRQQDFGATGSIECTVE